MKKYKERINCLKDSTPEKITRPENRLLVRRAAINKIIRDIRGLPMIKVVKGSGFGKMDSRQKEYNVKAMRTASFFLEFNFPGVERLAFPRS